MDEKTPFLAKELGVEIPAYADAITRYRFKTTLYNCRLATMSKAAVEKILSCLLQEQRERTNR